MFRVNSVILLVVAGLFFASFVFGFDDGDFQYWNTESISGKIADNWNIALEQEFRFGDDATNPYYNHTDIAIAYSGLCEWLVLGLNYRHVNEEKNNGWKVENRPHLNATVNLDLAGFKLANRGRMEYRGREDADDFFRFRNKLSLKAPFKLTRLEIQPYIADEGFYDFDAESLNRNRIYSGINFKIVENLSGEIYYLLERNKSNSTKKWTDVNALGTKLKVKF